MVAYNVLILWDGKLPQVNEITYSFYAVDYSLGFCSRMLAGTVYSLLVGVYSKTAVNIYLTVLYLLFYLLLAYLAEKFLLAFPDYKAERTILAVLFLTGPFSIPMLTKQFGMLDFHWAFLFFLSVLLLKNRYLRFVVPVFVVLMIMTHFAALICFVAALLLIILLYYSMSEEKRDRISFLILFTVCLVLGTGLTLYFILGDKNNIAVTLDEFERVVTGERSAYAHYFTYYFYDYIPADADFFVERYSGIDNSSAGLISSLFRQMQITFSSGISNRFFVANLFALPLQAFLFRFLFSYIKRESVFFKRLLTVAAAALSLVVEAVGFLFSTDNTRWLGHSCIILMVWFFLVMYYEYREGIERLKAVFSSAGYWLVVIVLFFYAGAVADPYTVPLQQQL
ncbi:MAG: hypothetical protein K6C36_04550 [Clostridia bacterium]|nr:hypothetical protein [Clostridia bacterium]